MRSIALAAIALVVSHGGAQAKTFCLGNLGRQASALAQSLLHGAEAPDEDVIAPRSDIDPQMAVAPPRSGRMRVITPDDARPRQP